MLYEICKQYNVVMAEIEKLIKSVDAEDESWLKPKGFMFCHYMKQAAINAESELNEMASDVYELEDEFASRKGETCYSL